MTTEPVPAVAPTVDEPSPRGRGRTPTDPAAVPISNPGVSVVTLASLAGGAAEQLFRGALDAVLDNIDDPNTDPKAKREIVLKITIRPNENRRGADLGVACVKRLAPQLPVSTSVLIGRVGPTLAAGELLPQGQLFPGAAVPRPAIVKSQGTE